MNLEDKDFGEISKNVSNEWMKNNILYKLIELQQAVGLMSEGCINLEEYLANYPAINLDIVKYKNYKLFLSDSELLLSISKNLLGYRYNKIKLKIEGLKLLNEKQDGWLITRQTDAIRRINETNIKDGFELVEKECLKIFEDFVEALWKYLTPKTESEDKKNNI